MTTRRGLPREPTFTFTGTMDVQRPAHDCGTHGHRWKKSSTVWSEPPWHETEPRLTQTCTACGVIQGRSMR